MSGAPFEDSPEELHALVEAACGLQQRLLERAQSLLVTLERPACTWVVEDGVHAYIAHFGPGRLPAPEQEALRECLRRDIQMLQQLPEQLAPLRTVLDMWTGPEC